MEKGQNISMNEEYISIPEFAKRAGVSHQAIYKRLRNQLQPYLQLVAGKKMLSEKALTLFDCNQVAQPSATKSATGLQSDSSVEAVILVLQEQLQAKDEQLKEKDRQLQAKDEQIASLHRIMEQQNTLAFADKPTMYKLAGRTDPEEGDAEELAAEPPELEKKWYQFWK